MKVSKTLTTLSVAAALAVGGIAVAQTSGQGENANDASQSSTLQANPSSSDASSSTSAPDTSTLGASSGSMDSNASAEASTTTTDEPVAQVDRN